MVLVEDRFLQLEALRRVEWGNVVTNATVERGASKTEKPGCE